MREHTVTHEVIDIRGDDISSLVADVAKIIMRCVPPDVHFAVMVFAQDPDDGLSFISSQPPAVLIDRLANVQVQEHRRKPDA